MYPKHTPYCPYRKQRFAGIAKSKGLGVIGNLDSDSGDYYNYVVLMSGTQVVHPVSIVPLPDSALDGKDFKIDIDNVVTAFYNRVDDEFYMLPSVTNGRIMNLDTLRSVYSFKENK